MKKRQSNDYSDDDYEEDFQDKPEDEDQDEMERIRNAMQREKAKADKYKERQIHREREEQQKHKFQAAANNPLQLNKNLDGFMKQKGLVVGEQIDHMAANRQKVRAKELRELLQLSSEE